MSRIPITGSTMLRLGLSYLVAACHIRHPLWARVSRQAEDASHRRPAMRRSTRTGAVSLV